MNRYFQFARPLFQVSLLVFIGGAVPLARAGGWQRDSVPTRGSKVGGVLRSYLRAH
jgi:hypothetical protein